MHCESIKKEQILVVTPMYKAKLEKNIDACKSTKHNSVKIEPFKA